MEICSCAHFFRPRLEALDGRWLPSLILSAAYPVGDGPRDVVTADFNGDGRLDLATSHTDDDSVSVLLGAGDGSFGSALRIEAASPETLDVGDFNGDGNADLVTLYSTSNGAWIYGRIDVFLSNGDGSFQPSRTAHVSDDLLLSGPVAVRVADINEDGRSDLGIDGFYAWIEPGDMYINWAPYFAGLTANLGGSFTWTTGDPADFPQAPDPDVDGDGRGDVVQPTGGTGVSVQLGLPDGTLAPAVDYPSGSAPWAVTVGDFNGDGRPDAATANHDTDDVSVLLNDGIWPDVNVPTIRIGEAVVTEGNTGAREVTFTVTLSAAHWQPVTVDYATSDGTAASSDYQAAGGALTFAPGETTRNVTVLVLGDRVGEENEWFKVNLMAATNAIISDDQAVGTILDDEPCISINSASIMEGNSGTKAMTFTVTLSAAYDQTVTVHFATHDDTAKAADNDYVATSGTLTFAPGETSKTFTVMIKGDKKKEADESFYVLLSDASSNALIDSAYGWGTILNDDPSKGRR
jgi:Calx-beta domain/FG-GAP-like repeat